MTNYIEFVLLKHLEDIEAERGKITVEGRKNVGTQTKTDDQ